MSLMLIFNHCVITANFGGGGAIMGSRNLFEGELPLPPPVDRTLQCLEVRNFQAILEEIGE